MRLKTKKKSLVISFILLFSIYLLYRRATRINDYDTEIHSDVITKINLNELYEISKCLVKEAGEKIMEIRAKNDLKIKNKDFDKSVVTEADLVSHQIIVHTLKYKYNNLNIMSEENSAGKNDVDVDYYLNKCGAYNETPNDFLYSSNALTVWIDPLDATQEYTENLIDYVSIMFCLVINGSPRDWSWITDENSISEKEVSGDPSKIRVVVSRSHTGKVKSYINKYMNNTEIIEAAGSGYKSIYVAKNKADLYLHTSRIYKWDLCAPNAILSSMKGRLTDLNGSFINYSHKSKEKAITGVIASVNNFDQYLKAFAGKTID